MVGQKNLLNHINKYSIDTLPHSILLLGEKGSGRHEIIKYISNKFYMDIRSLDVIGDEIIEKIYLNVNPAIYVIDVSAMRLGKDQNVLLKFVEEPPTNAFVILLAENKINLLNTVVNRCIVFTMDKYTRDELKEFTKGKANEDLLLDLYRTPGQIINAPVTDLVALNKLCDAIVTSLAKANYANTLTIVNKINYRDDYNKFDFDSFVEMLVFKLFNRYLEENNINYLNMYLAVVEERKKLILYKTINKEIWLENLLTRLWKMLRQ